MVQTPEPQAILMAPTEAAIFLVLCVDEGAEDAVRDLLRDVGGLIRSVGFRIPDGGLGCVVGVGSALWDRLVGWSRPAGLHPFAGLSGSRHTAVATPGDLLFHIRAHRADLCFELAQRLVERLCGSAEVVDEVHGFKSFDERDLLGFVDGTENPVGAAAPAAAVIGEEDPDFAGGSYVHGWSHSATNLGRTSLLASAPGEGVTGLQRRVLALVEARADFEVSLEELRDADRGAADADLDELDCAAHRIAVAENVAVFHGWSGAIAGITQASPMSRSRSGPPRNIRARSQSEIDRRRVLAESGCASA